MAENPTALQNTKQSFARQTDIRTIAAETANGALPLSIDGNDWNLERESIPNPLMTGSFTKRAPLPGMYSEDIGPTTQTILVGDGTLSEPPWSIPMESLFGIQNENTDGVCDAGCTTDVIQVKSGGGDLTPGKQLYFPAQDEVRAVILESAGEIQLDVPLSAAPSDDDTFIAGIDWMLSSTLQPAFTSYTHFEGPKQLIYGGCITTALNMAVEAGQIVPMTFTNKAILEPDENYDAQVVTPNYDDTTKPMTCLGMTGFTEFSAVATGTPTTIETILTAPPFEVAIGDKIRIDVGASVWETVAITGVTGDAGSNITIDHAAVSVAASALDTVYIQRVQCNQNLGDSMEFVIEKTDETQKCIFSSSGYTDRKTLDRTVTFTPTPYFLSWQNLKLRDEVKGSALQMLFSNKQFGGNDLVSVYIRNKVNTEYSLTSDGYMREGVTMQAVKDDVMGDDHEIIISSFKIS